MTIALRKVPQIEKLIVVDSAPVKVRLSEDFASYVSAMKKVDDAKVSKQSIADEILRDTVPEVTIRQFLLTNLKKDPNTGIYSFRIPLDILGDSLEGLSGFPFDSAHNTFHKKTLFIAGTKSNYITPKMHPAIKTFFPEAVIADVDAGHWVHAEKPYEFSTIVIDFVENN